MKRGVGESAQASASGGWPSRRTTALSWRRPPGLELCWRVVTPMDPALHPDSLTLRHYQASTSRRAVVGRRLRSIGAICLCTSSPLRLDIAA